MSDGVEALMQALFGADWSLDRSGNVVAGRARLNGREIAVLGTVEQTEIGASEALSLARAVLDAVKADGDREQRRDILMIVDNAGQRLALREELIGNAGYLAHLAQCLWAADRAGHRVLGLVHTLALSGGFMATGMAAPRCDALAGSEVRVMRMDAMARITRIPRERLDELVRSSPVFGPGAQNYLAIGALHEIWPEPTAEALERAFSEITPGGDDHRQALGRERGGRRHAAEAAALVRDA